MYRHKWQSQTFTVTSIFARSYYYILPLVHSCIAIFSIDVCVAVCRTQGWAVSLAIQKQCNGVCSDAIYRLDDRYSYYLCFVTLQCIITPTLFPIHLNYYSGSCTMPHLEHRDADIWTSATYVCTHICMCLWEHSSYVKDNICVSKLITFTCAIYAHMWVAHGPVNTIIFALILRTLKKKITISCCATLESRKIQNIEFLGLN